MAAGHQAAIAATSVQPAARVRYFEMYHSASVLTRAG